MKKTNSSACFSLPFEVIELELNSYHILIPASINGITGDLIIDTGASVSVIDRELFRELPEKTASLKIQSGSITGEISEVQIVEPRCVMLGDIPVSLPQLATIDLSYINEMYGSSRQRRIIGLLGCDFCLSHSAIINYRTKTFRFKKSRKAERVEEV